MKAGKYLITDLCRVLPKELWKKVLTVEGTERTVDGITIGIVETPGDGCFDGTEGAVFVDSGTIGCILVSDAEKFGYTIKTEAKQVFEIEDCVVEFTDEFDVEQYEEYAYFGFVKFDFLDEED
jgi:hypothetical protein